AKPQQLPIEPEAPVLALCVQAPGDLVLRFHPHQLAGAEIEDLELLPLCGGGGQVDLGNDAELAERFPDRGAGAYAEEICERDVARSVLARVTAGVPRPQVLGASRQIG